MIIAYTNLLFGFFFSIYILSISNGVLFNALCVYICTCGNFVAHMVFFVTE